MEKYIGKVLNDRYMITEVIGVGGMAYVYKAFDKVCNRVVAVKILKDEFMSDAQFRRRFTNESKAITMLSHNNIVDVYDVSLEGDALYIVMEYIDGITLKEYMEKKGALSSVEAIHFIRQILKGLAHAHERGIVHRDIKPHNIILLKDGTIKITDFGIARLTKFDTQTISDMTIGSVHYISPEQASGDRTDERSDIYSVGIILYEMLTGRLPFEADTAVAVALKQVQAQPELPTELNPDLPQGLEDITLKAIMKDPAMRYQSAGAILADIALFESDPTITFNYTAGPLAEEEVAEDNSPTLFAEGLVTDEQAAEGEEGEEDAAEAEEKSKFKTTWLPIIAGVGTAFLVLVLVALGIIFQKELFGSKTVACPSVVGMTLEEAKNSNNFEFVVESTAPSDKYEEGKIITQTPEANSQIKKKGKITVVLSSGPAEDDEKNNDNEEESKVAVNYVPDVLGYTKASAIAEFNRQDIAYRIESKYDDTVGEGCVISTSPKPGEEVFEDTTVVIYISKGPKEPVKDEVETVSMPDLSDMTEEAAKKTLKNNKLEIGTVKSENHDTVEVGKVISQSVLKDVSVEVGTKIDIVISLGPKEEEKTPVEETPTTPGETEDDSKTETENVVISMNLAEHKDKEVTISVKTADGTEIQSWTEKVTADTVEKTVTREKDAELTVTVDGTVVEATIKKV